MVKTVCDGCGEEVSKHGSSHVLTRNDSLFMGSSFERGPWHFHDKKCLKKWLSIKSTS